MRWMLVAALTLMGGPTAVTQNPQAKPHRCAGAAVTQAEKLLQFHMGEDDRIAVDTAVRQLPSLRNPAAPTQRFDVLEVRGTIYKGEYRMRLIYAQMPGQCLLMGQEILELARL